MNQELKISYEILTKVIIDKSYVSIELNKYLNENQGTFNSSLVTKIVYGVLEKDIMLEHFILQYMKKLPKPNILILLKIVAYVAKAVNSIPHYALVNEVVTISKTIDYHQSGFVNAVSKKLISGDVILPDKKNITKYLSVRYNYPEWVIVELLKKHDVQFVKDLISCELTSMTHIRVNLDKISAQEFKELLTQKSIKFENSLYDYTMYVDYSKLLEETDLKGYYIVQGLPSIITCNVLGVVGSILDVCSAPGGKSVYLAQNSKNSVTSADIHKHRVELVKKYANTYGVKLNACVQDATKLKEEWIQKFDCVMCDVPCSNLGVSRKKPDVFLNKTLADAKTLSSIQYKILDNSSKYVKSGGVLQYSTCTILDLENKSVVEHFLKEHSDFELTTIDCQGLNISQENKMYTFYSHLTGTEGFFIARLKRK
ncbi:MAG: 16S rRNA (cytosine(967)-C(5))-methyltransferase RsmB [Clostridia bacterium]|nr:16S rRNA (cytosine(967)-C(5))-methyltransferase RsmB [Clostridia bacterium]